MQCMQTFAACALFTLGFALPQSSVEQVNEVLRKQQDLRTVPCEGLSIFSLRVALKELLSAKHSPRTSAYPIYASEAEMKDQWKAIPGVQPGDNPESRLVKYAHCHEAVMWYTQHLSADEKKSFSHANFLPLLPTSELPVEAKDAFTRFYVSKVKCEECSIGSNTEPSSAIEQLNQQLVSQDSLRTVPCEHLSIFSLRVVLKELLKAKTSTESGVYPIYATEEEMKAQWKKLPGVQPGLNPESRLMIHAHCHEAVMWYTQHLSAEAQHSFARKNFLPLLPTNELPAEGKDTLTQFYVSKVQCPECRLDQAKTSYFV